MRIVSICPSNTELLTYLNLEQQIVGLDDYSDWPESIQHLPRLGPDLSINMDTLQALQPDLVVASLSVPGMEKNVAALKERHIPHIVLNPNTLEEIATDLITLGTACGIEEHARKVAEDYRRFIKEMGNIAKTIQTKPTLYWEWWPKPVFTPGRLNWLTEISELAGATNLFRDVELASVQTDWKDVQERNPDYILLAWVGVQFEKIQPKLLHKRPHWPDMDAMQKNRVHIMEEWLYCRPSPRLLEGAWKLAKLLHPEAYKDLVLPDWM